MLYGVPADSLALPAISAVVLLVPIAAASYLPARRAMKLDPARSAQTRVVGNRASASARSSPAELCRALLSSLRMQAQTSIPFGKIETVFLDVGNTLVSMDYSWIRDELGGLGVHVTLEAIMRAEAAARPIISAAIEQDASTEGTPIFTLYLRTLVEGLACDVASDDLDSDAIARALVPVLRDAGRRKLWTSVLPGVPEALASLRRLGRKLAVVSNSDGTVERILIEQGLRGSLDAVFDSAIVGHEKPDPQFFLHALRETGARPESTLHVGDLYAADVVGGRAAGLHTALLDPYGDWDGVDCVRFRSLLEVAEVFRANVK